MYVSVENKDSRFGEDFSGSVKAAATLYEHAREVDERVHAGETAMAVNYLDTFGYFTKELAGWKDISIGDIVNAISAFQNFFGLKQTGQLDTKTVRAMEAYRCGCPDLVQEDHPQGQQYMKIKEFAETNLPRWRKSSIQYCVAEYVSGLGKIEQDDIIARAFQSWEDVSGINVEARRSGDCDIVIGVGRGQRSNFDGPGGVLAWAYLPDGSDQQLQMKFDLDETWLGLNSRNRGILMLNVAAHEFGHLLGLDHSRVQTALMAPYYNANIATPQQDDDIPRIQARYPRTPGTPVPPQPPTPPVPGVNTITIEGASRILLNGQRVA